MPRPRLRRRQWVRPPYPLNTFPPNFALNVGRQIVYLLATKTEPTFEGPEWEMVFAEAIQADWKPSNVGLDDIVKDNCAWGAKTVKVPNPFSAEGVRLISGRNSPDVSFGFIADTDEGIGEQVLDIWNGRVDELRKQYNDIRTVVLLKGPHLTEFVVFEHETVRFPTDLYDWRRNRNNNLEGFERATGEHRFTWQRSGSQFTILEDVPSNRLKFLVQLPPKPDINSTLVRIGFNPSWIQVLP